MLCDIAPRSSSAQSQRARKAKRQAARQEQAAVERSIRVSSSAVQYHAYYYGVGQFLWNHSRKSPERQELRKPARLRFYSIERGACGLYSTSRETDRAISTEPNIYPLFWVVRPLKIFVWMVCSVFGGCFSEVLLRYERLPFASQLGWLGLLRHGAQHWSNTVASEFTQTRVTSCGLCLPLWCCSATFACGGTCHS